VNDGETNRVGQMQFSEHEENGAVNRIGGDNDQRKVSIATSLSNNAKRPYPITAKMGTLNLQNSERPCVMRSDRNDPPTRRHAKPEGRTLRLKARMVTSELLRVGGRVRSSRAGPMTNIISATITCYGENR